MFKASAVVFVLVNSRKIASSQLEEKREFLMKIMNLKYMFKC
tara:strand:- start:97 stop:222 length:126 start_codon:yes stop_codon:yes gene_type:complete